MARGALLGGPGRAKDDAGGGAAYELVVRSSHRLIAKSQWLILSGESNSSGKENRARGTKRGGTPKFHHCCTKKKGKISARRTTVGVCADDSRLIITRSRVKEKSFSSCRGIGRRTKSTQAEVFQLGSAATRPTRNKVRWVAARPRWGAPPVREPDPRSAKKRHRETGSISPEKKGRGTN